MQRLLTYETFVPKNIEKRVKDLERIEAKQLIDFNVFVDEFKKNLMAIQGLKVKCFDEQYFIDLFKNSYIKLIQPRIIKIYSAYPMEKLLFTYDFQKDILTYQRKYVNNLDFKMIGFLFSMVEKYFKFKPAQLY